MAKSKITRKFETTSLATVLASTILSKLLTILYVSLSSDIMITGSDSAAVRLLPSVLRYVGVFFDTAALTAAMASVVWALSFFGRRRAAKTGLISVACCFGGVCISMVYSLIVNELSAAQIIAAALTLLINVAYFAAAITGAYGFCFIFLKSSEKAERRISLWKPAACTCAALLLLHLADLTAFSVVPFIINNTVIDSDIYTIVSDYVYYVIIYGLLPFAQMLLFFVILKRITGELKQKPYTIYPRRKEQS